MDEEAVAELVRGELKRLMEEHSSDTFSGTRMGDFEDFADGSKQHVDTVGNIRLSNNLELNSVLHHHRTSKTVAVGRLLGKLYILDENSFKPELVNSTLKENLEQSLVPEQHLRRSSRISTKPTWMQDFYCNYIALTDSPPPISAFSSLHTCFLASLSNLQEPRTHQQACQSKEWQHAMQTELDAMHKNNTWDLTPLPKGQKAIGCRWIFKLKLKADGTVDKYKARLVAKGYNQVEGIEITWTTSLPWPRQSLLECS
ncbi:UNVERIFIED_CONTAM: putative mitochondrial protein [Sesamum latifolium]|uniref:Mitochondrial protein n=1 Tax=Sesamum latifolium TaxID=2727402 RepID=A0AAW2U2C6_9LAMI